MGVILEIAIKNRGGLLLIPQARPDMLEKGKKESIKEKGQERKVKEEGHPVKVTLL